MHISVIRNDNCWLNKTRPLCAGIKNRNKSQFVRKFFTVFHSFFCSVFVLICINLFTFAEFSSFIEIEFLVKFFFVGFLRFWSLEFYTDEHIFASFNSITTNSVSLQIWNEPTRYTRKRTAYVNDYAMTRLISSLSSFFLSLTHTHIALTALTHTHIAHARMPSINGQLQYTTITMRWYEMPHHQSPSSCIDRWFFTILFCCCYTSTM